MLPRVATATCWRVVLRMGSQMTAQTDWALVKNDCWCDRRKSSLVLPLRSVVLVLVVVEEQGPEYHHWMCLCYFYYRSDQAAL